VKVAFTLEAERGLEAIGDFIARDNPMRAISYVEELREKAHGLADIPGAFPLIAGFERQGVRRRVHCDYLIFYRECDDRIEIIHILHGARDYEAILSEL
jgi:toxin ParE1/3/4